jgi:hypothetical protein
MYSRLPANPTTMSDGRPRANTWTPETVAAKYRDRDRTQGLIDEAHRDLE